MKKIFIHGLVGGALAALASVIYFNLYQATLGAAFDSIINLGSIIGASMIGCMFMTIGEYLLIKFKKERFRGFLNLLIITLSFVSMISPIGMSLPLEIEAPELFPGLVIPMHFFPALAFFAIAPFFNQKNKIIQ